MDVHENGADDPSSCTIEGNKLTRSPGAAVDLMQETAEMNITSSGLLLPDM